MINNTTMYVLRVRLRRIKSKNEQVVCQCWFGTLAEARKYRDAWIKERSAWLRSYARSYAAEIFREDVKVWEG